MKFTTDPQGQMSPHFKRFEVACECCGRIGAYNSNLVKTLFHLEKMRTEARQPVIIKPGHCLYRCRKHNAEVGGVSDSLHLKALAVDFHIEDFSVEAMAILAERAGFTGIGRYYTKGFVHADIGDGSRRWEE